MLNNGLLAKENFTFSLFIGSYNLDVSAIPTTHRADED